MDIVPSEQNNADPTLCVDNNELNGFDTEARILRGVKYKEEVVSQGVPTLEIDESHIKEITLEFVRENDLPSSQKDEAKTDVPSLQIHGAYCKAGATDVSSSQMDATYHEAITAQVLSPVTEFKLVMDPVPEGTKMNTKGEIILAQQGAPITQVGKVVNGPQKDKKKMKKEDSVKNAIDYYNKSKQKEKSFPKAAGSNGHVPSQTEHDRKKSVTKLSNGITSMPSNPHTSFYAENNKEIAPEFVRKNDLPRSKKDEAKTDVPFLQIDGANHEARTTEVSSPQKDATHHEAIPAEVVSPVLEIKLVVDSVPEGPKRKTMGEMILAEQGATVPRAGKAVNGTDKDEKKINKKDSLKHAIDYSNKSKQMEKPFPEEFSASNEHAPSQTEDDRKESATKLSNGRTSMPSNPHTSCYAENSKEITPEFVRENDLPSSENDEAKTDVPFLQILEAYDEARTTDLSSSQMDVTHLEAIPAEVVSPVTEIKLVVDSVPEDPKMETMGEIILAPQGTTIPQVGKAVNGPEKDEREMKKKDSLKHTIDYSNKSKQKEKPFPKAAVSNGHVPSQTKNDRKKSATKMSNGRTSVPSNPRTSLYAKTNKEVTPKFVRENNLTSSQKDEADTDVPSLQINGACHEARTNDVSSSPMDITHHVAIPAEVVYPVTEIKLVVDSVPEGPKMETMGEIILAQQGATLQHIGNAVNGPEKDEKKMTMTDSLKHAIDYSNKSKQREKIFPQEAASSNGHVPSQTKHGRKKSPTNLSNGRTSVSSNPNTSYYAKNIPCVPRKVGKEETIPKKKKSGLQTRENKRSASDSLHMSICSGPQHAANITVPQPFVLATDRRVSIIQNLGDKEIVKCAFKTFRHSLSIPGLAKTEAPANEIANEVAGSTTPHQKHGRSDDNNAQRCMKLVGAKDGEDKNGSSETSVNGRKLNSRVSSTAFSLKSVERAEKRKEFYMKLHEKLNAKEAEKNKIQANTKDEIEAEVRKLRKSLNFHATPMPSFYKESAPQKREIKKIPLTRAKSPKLGRKNTNSATDLDVGSQASKDALNQEINKNGYIEKHTNRNAKNGKTSQSTESNMIPKKNQKRETSVKSSGKRSKATLKNSEASETDLIYIIGKRNSSSEEDYDEPNKGKEPSSTELIVKKSLNLQSDQELGPEENIFANNSILMPIVRKKDDIESGTDGETITGGKRDVVEDKVSYDFEEMVVVQNVHEAINSDEVMDKNSYTCNSASGGKNKTKAQPHCSSCSYQEPNDRATKLAKYDRQKSAMVTGNGKQEATKTFPIRRVTKGSTGLNAFVTDVTVAS